MTRLLLATAVLWLMLPAAARAADRDAILMIRTSAKPPDAVVTALESYARDHEWIFLGANKVKKGQVTLVKLCIPEVGRLIWPVGLQLSALLPCGNLGIYQKDGATEISALHPRYMNVLYPDPAVERAAALAAPLLAEMLDTIAK